MAKTRLVGKAWQEASAVFGGAVGVALVDPSFAKLIAVAAFAVVYAATVVLFAQLQEASELPGTEVPAWLDTSVLVIVGAGVGLSITYTDAIRVGLAMPLAVLAAFIPTAWRQRWRERRIYREDLLRPS